jgi:YesN/AraC family two-component response regulator
VDAHYGNPDLSLALLSDEFDLNPSSISTLFKEEFGEKFVVYVSQVRMEHAKALLRNSEHSIQEIAEKVGYLHQMSFIRAFKKQVGTTPGDYRKVHQ